MSDALRLIGYWRSERQPQWPDPEAFVDRGWARQDRDAVIDYLGHGMLYSAYLGSSECRVCGCANGSREFTDGSYVWPEGLAHYLEQHAVRLPQEFVEHVLASADRLHGAELDRSWWSRQAPPGAGEPERRP